MLRKKYVKTVCTICLLVILTILFQPSAQASAPSAFNKIQASAIQKKIAHIRAKVKVKVDTTHEKKVEEKKIEEKKVAAQKAAALKKQQEEKIRQQKAAEQAEQSQRAASNSEPNQSSQSSDSGTQKNNTQKVTPNSETSGQKEQQSSQPDVTTGASQSGREIGEKNREYGNKLSDPNLSDAERQRIIEEKKNYNQSHR